ncbi:MAG: DUF4166 domain-containing protein [Fimbriimonadaceae bacterium]
MNLVSNPYEEMAGPAWATLAPGVRLAHSPPLSATGVLRILKGTNRLLRFIALPPPGDAVATTLELEQVPEGVKWTRTFDGMRAVSLHMIRGHEIQERAGPFRLALRMVVDGQSVWHRHIGTWFLGVPIPKALGPQVKGHVSPGSDDRSWRIDVKIWHFLLGPICHYQGEIRAV